MHPTITYCISEGKIPCIGVKMILVNRSCVRYELIMGCKFLTVKAKLISIQLNEVSITQISKLLWGLFGCTNTTCYLWSGGAAIQVFVIRCLVYDFPEYQIYIVKLCIPENGYRWITWVFWVSYYPIILTFLSLQVYLAHHLIPLQEILYRNLRLFAFVFPYLW